MTNEMRDALFAHLREREPAFRDASFDGDTVTARGGPSGARRISFVATDRGVGAAVTSMARSARGLWPNLDPRTAAFQLIAVHMEEVLQLPDVISRYDEDREYILTNGAWELVAGDDT
jgi:hypothetical protein